MTNLLQKIPYRSLITALWNCLHYAAISLSFFHRARDRGGLGVGARLPGSGASASGRTCQGAEPASGMEEQAALGCRCRARLPGAGPSSGREGRASGREGRAALGRWRRGVPAGESSRHQGTTTGDRGRRRGVKGGRCRCRRGRRWRGRRRRWPGVRMRCQTGRAGGRGAGALSIFYEYYWITT
jgi:hypothetical protein